MIRKSLRAYNTSRGAFFWPHQILPMGIGYTGQAV